MNGLNSFENIVAGTGVTRMSRIVMRESDGEGHSRDGNAIQHPMKILKQLGKSESHVEASYKNMKMK